jgi:hypothetical protein
MKSEDAEKIASNDETFKLHMVESSARMETTLESLCGRVDSLETEQTAQGKAITGLEVKSGVWGVLAGIVAGILAFLGMKIKSGGE